MFMNADIPATKVVPASGIASTRGSPFAGYPAGWSSIAEKIVARMTEMKVKNADAVPNKARVLKVRGNDAKKETAATIALKPIVQRP